jgi:HlyD family secretion protein
VNNDPQTRPLDLPLLDNGVERASSDDTGSRRRSRWKLILLLWLTFGAGAVVGLYFQPPGLKLFFGLTGLEPGGGTDTPIAVAIQQVQAQEEIAVISEGDIVALGRILPASNVLAIATPFGASDARVQALNVSVGDKVAAGDVLAVLDNRTQFQNALDAAVANVRVREAMLLQTREKIRASREEAIADLARAKATAAQAQAELDRLTPLLGRGITTRAEFDLAEARAQEAARDVERRRATLSRYETSSGTVQADIAVAEANLQAARVEVARAKGDLEHSIVRAPIDGTVIDINTQVGERPRGEGLLELGNTTDMVVEAGVYQSLIGRVMIGDPAKVFSEAVDGELTGVVQAIGLEIGRQSITSRDPAANTDARVVDVIIQLDEASSKKARRLTNLEAIVRIDAGRAE